MTPFTDVDEALRYIARFPGRAEELRLPISDSLQDPVGVSLTLVTDEVLARGWEPAGYEQMDGYRIYLYRELA